MTERIEQQINKEKYEPLDANDILGIGELSKQFEKNDNFMKEIMFDEGIYENARTLQFENWYNLDIEKGWNI